MNVTYTTKNGKLSGFLWTDLMENDPCRGSIELAPLNMNGHPVTNEQSFPTQMENGRLYVEYRGEKVFLDSYDHMTYEEALKRQMETPKGERWCSMDELCALFIKETDNIGIVGEMELYGMIFPGLGIAEVTENTRTTLCVPTEKRFKKSHWSYKFTLEAENKDERASVANRDYYFSDFYSMLIRGIFTLVDKNEYKNCAMKSVAVG